MPTVKPKTKPKASASAKAKIKQKIVQQVKIIFGSDIEIRKKKKRRKVKRKTKPLIPFKGYNAPTSTNQLFPTYQPNFRSGLNEMTSLQSNYNDLTSRIESLNKKIEIGLQGQFRDKEKQIADRNNLLEEQKEEQIEFMPEIIMPEIEKPKIEQPIVLESMQERDIRLPVSQVNINTELRIPEPQPKPMPLEIFEETKQAEEPSPLPSREIATEVESLKALISRLFFDMTDKAEEQEFVAQNPDFFTKTGKLKADSKLVKLIQDKPNEYQRFQNRIDETMEMMML